MSATKVDVVAPETVIFDCSMVAVHLVELSPGSGISTVGPPAPGGQVHEMVPPGAEVEVDPIGAAVGLLVKNPSAPAPSDSDPDPPSGQPLPAPLFFCFLDGAFTDGAFKDGAFKADGDFVLLALEQGSFQDQDFLEPFPSPLGVALQVGASCSKSSTVSS